MEIIVCTPKDARFGTYFPGVNLQAAWLKYGLVLLLGTRVLGALCLYDNPYIHQEGRSVLLIGNFTCVHDLGAANLLFEQTMTIADTEGKKFIAGPMNGSVWADYRLPLTGEKPLFTGDLSSPFYHSTLFYAAGFNVIHRYYSSASSISVTVPKITLPANIHIRNLDTNNLERELELLYPICETAFSANPFYSPLSKAAFIEKYAALKPLLDDRLLTVALQDTVPIAFLFAYADPQQSGTLVMKTIAKHPEYPVCGLMSSMAGALYADAAAMGYRQVVHAFMHEHNRSLIRSAAFAGSVIRTYALFGKNVGA